MPNLYVDHVNGDNNSTIYIHDAELRNTLGQANGIATLDNTGKLPTSQLPNSVNNKLEASTLASENETEATTTATKAHAKDSKFYLAATGEYCMAKTAIAIGDTLVKDTNYQVISINGFLTSLESYLILAGQILDTKADKVTNATNGNLAGLNGSGNLTDSGWNGAKDTTSISDNPISISGLKANQLAIDPIITLEPIQAGSGTPSPSNIRAISGYDRVEVESCGKNLYIDSPYFDDYTQSPANSWTKQIDKYNQHDVWKSTSAAWNRLYKMRYLPVGTYVFSCMVKSDDTGLAQIYATIQGTTTATVTTTENAQNLTTSWKRWTYKFNVTVAGLVALRIEKQTAGVLYVSEYQIEEANSFTEFVPYVKATSISESLGQTVYGGTLDVRTGKFTVTHKRVKISDLTWNWYASGGYFYAQPSDKAYGQRNVISSAYKTASNTENYTIYGHASAINVHIRDDSFSGNITNFTTTMGDETICYELSDSAKFTIQLTPHEISLLKDYAYVSTNGTNIALDYHNGELASLGDVAQVGETVNELGNKYSFKKLDITHVVGLVTADTRYGWILSDDYPHITADNIISITVSCPWGYNARDYKGIISWQTGTNDSKIQINYVSQYAQDGARYRVICVYQ